MFNKEKTGVKTIVFLFCQRLNIYDMDLFENKFYYRTSFMHHVMILFCPVFLVNGIIHKSFFQYCMYCNVGFVNYSGLRNAYTMMLKGNFIFKPKPYFHIFLGCELAAS